MKIPQGLICLLPVCLLGFIFSACPGKNPSPGNQNIKKSVDSLSPAYRKPASGSRDTLRIEGEAAVFYNADSVQVGKIRSAMNKMAFENDVHDCFYQMRNARRVLKETWPKLRIYESVGPRYLLFAGQAQRFTCIDLDKRNEMCGLFIFRPSKDPLFADMTNIETELGFYFDK